MSSSEHCLANLHEIGDSVVAITNELRQISLMNVIKIR